MLVSSLATTHQNVTRCAICKIDRKGRFVYTNSEAEELFGLSQMELFGKPFLEFVAPENHSQIVMITSQSSRYETFYDSTWVKLIDNEGRVSPVWIIFSLNFDGGNPVNYQLVIHQSGEKEIGERRESVDPGAKGFLEHLASLYDLSNSEETASNLCQFSHAKGVGVYNTGSTHPRLLSAAASSEFEDHVERENVIKLLNSDFDPDASQIYEYRATVGEEDSYLIRFLLHADQNDEERGLTIELASMATLLLDRLLGLSQTNKGSVTTPAGTYPLLDILQNMTLGGAMTGSDGQIVAANDSFRMLLNTTLKDMDIPGLTHLFAKTNSKKIISLISNYFKTSVKTESNHPLSIRIRLAYERYADLSFFLLLPGTGNLTGYFTLNPVERFLSSGGYSYPSEGFISSVLDNIRGGIAASKTLTDSLHEEIIKDETDKSDFTINSIRNQLSTIERITTDLTNHLSTIYTSEKPKLTDPINLVAGVAERIFRTENNISYSILNSSIEMIELCSKRLAWIISLICREIGIAYKKIDPQKWDAVNIKVEMDENILSFIFESPVIQKVIGPNEKDRYHDKDTETRMNLLYELCHTLGGSLTISKTSPTKISKIEADIIELKIPV